MNLTILYILDYFAELIQLVFELGVFTGRVVIPAVAYLYVAIEFTYKKVIDITTSQEYTLRVYNTPLTTGLCAIA